MRVLFNLRRGLLAASTALAALPIAAQGQTQYAPYQQPAQQQQVQPQYVPAQQPYATPQSTQQYAQQQYAQPQYAQPQYSQPQYTQAAAPPVQGYSPAQGYVLPQYPTSNGVPYVALARQNNDPNAPVAPPTDLGAQAGQNGVYPQPVAGSDYAAAQGGMPQAGCNCQGNGYAQAAASGYENYPGGCNGANCSGYSTYGQCGPAGGRFQNLFSGYGAGAGCGYWFGGVYGLLMDRDNSNRYPLVMAAPTMPPGGYPASSDSIVLTTRAVDIGYQGGMEFRLGRTFGCGPTDPCGSNCGCAPQWGVESVFWTIFEEDDTALYVDQALLRTYSMMPMPGLEYDPGTGYRPVNEYWDYAPPAQLNDIEVRLARVRSSFEVQNFELNLLRLSICGSGCGGPAMCNVGCDSGSCGSDACAGGYGGGRLGGGGSRFSCTGVCGFRYLEFDEEFMYGVDYQNTTTLASGFLNYWSTVENSLIGAQVGCNGMYRIGCKWGIHVNTLVGLYGNDVDVRQYMVSPSGQVRYIATGENFDVNASKTDVAMLGELRLGASYQATCRCRLFGGWRAIGVTGIALATDQTPNQFLDPEQMSNYVNSNGSMILHGLQTGIEWNY